MSRVKTGSTDARIPDDLEVATVAVARLTAGVSASLHDLLEKVLPNPRVSAATLTRRVRKVATGLHSALHDAIAKFEAVRGKFEVARGPNPSAHETALVSIAAFCSFAETLPKRGLKLSPNVVQNWLPYVLGEQQVAFRANPSLDRNLIQRWLTRVQMRVEAVLADTNLDPKYERAGTFGLVAEWRQAVRRPTPPPRGKAGRKPDPTLPKVAERVRELRESEMQWKEVAKTIRGEFRPFSVNTLQKLLKVEKCRAK